MAKKGKTFTPQQAKLILEHVPILKNLKIEEALDYLDSLKLTAPDESVLIKQAFPNLEEFKYNAKLLRKHYNSYKKHGTADYAFNTPNAKTFRNYYDLINWYILLKNRAYTVGVSLQNPYIYKVKKHINKLHAETRNKKNEAPIVVRQCLQALETMMYHLWITTLPFKIDRIQSRTTSAIKYILKTAEKNNFNVEKLDILSDYFNNTFRIKYYYSHKCIETHANVIHSAIKSFLKEVYTIKDHSIVKSSEANKVLIVLTKHVNANLDYYKEKLTNTYINSLSTKQLLDFHSLIYDIHVVLEILMLDKLKTIDCVRGKYLLHILDLDLFVKQHLKSGNYKDAKAKLESEIIEFIPYLNMLKKPFLFFPDVQYFKSNDLLKVNESYINEKSEAVVNLEYNSESGLMENVMPIPNSNPRETEHECINAYITALTNRPKMLAKEIEIFIDDAELQILVLELYKANATLNQIVSILKRESGTYSLDIDFNTLHIPSDEIIALVSAEGVVSTFTVQMYMNTVLENVYVFNFMYARISRRVIETFTFKGLDSPNLIKKINSLIDKHDVEIDRPLKRVANMRLTRTDNTENRKSYFISMLNFVSLNKNNTNMTAYKSKRLLQNSKKIKSILTNETSLKSNSFLLSNGGISQEHLRDLERFFPEEFFIYLNLKDKLTAK